MEFGKDLRRRFGRTHGPESLGADASVLELLSVEALRVETRAAEAAAEASPVGEKGRRRLDQARILREIGRRTGEPETLLKAASVAERAGSEAAGDMTLYATARLEQAVSALTMIELFGVGDEGESALTWFDEGSAGLSARPGLRGPVAIALARLRSRRALAYGDLDDAVTAAGAFDDAIELLDAHVRDTGFGRVEAAAARCERAELLIGFGGRLKERKLLDQAQLDMRQLGARIDPDYLPLSWGRIMALRGTALAALGDLTGDAQIISKGVDALLVARDTVSIEHSPLDHARISHGLGLARQALGEAADDDDRFDIAVADFDRALRVLDSHPSLRLRPVAAYDRAACMARRAERMREPEALDKAVLAFKAELQAGPAGADPLAWAVLQLALARVYESRHALVGDTYGSGDGALGLSEALDVFTERGLKSLAEIAAAGLERMREGSGAS